MAQDDDNEVLVAWDKAGRNGEFLSLTFKQDVRAGDRVLMFRQDAKGNGPTWSGIWPSESAPPQRGRSAPQPQQRQGYRPQQQTQQPRAQQQRGPQQRAPYRPNNQDRGSQPRRPNRQDDYPNGDQDDDVPF